MTQFSFVASSVRHMIILYMILFITIKNNTEGKCVLLLIASPRIISCHTVNDPRGTLLLAGYAELALSVPPKIAANVKAQVFSNISSTSHLHRFTSLQDHDLTRPSNRTIRPIRLYRRVVSHCRYAK